MTEQIFTYADGSHQGHFAPGGAGVHRMDDEYGNIWEIHYEPERFRVYRRWNVLPVIEGEFSVLSDDAGDTTEQSYNDYCDEEDRK